MVRKTVCVTGGAGFIGSHLGDAFVAYGDRELVIGGLPTGRRSNVPPQELDIRGGTAELIARAGIDLLVYQAAQRDVRRSAAEPDFDAGVNVLGTFNFLAAARRRGVRQTKE